MRLRHQRFLWLPTLGGETGSTVVIRQHFDLQHDVRRLDQYDVGDPRITE
jgi:hypothetical protein